MYPGLTLLALTLTPVTPPAGGTLWWNEGHRLVARIAEARLTPKTLAVTRKLLGDESLADVASWADQLKNPRTSRLHYVNIPLDASRYQPEEDCPAGRCLIGAIERYRAELSDKASSPVKRAEALRFLVHFIGDLHQPLHVSNRGDRGGNQTQVRLEGVGGSNLHKVWDGQLTEAEYPDEGTHWERLQTRMSSLDLTAMTNGSIIDWAMEAHALAREAYEIPRNRRLDQAYIEKSSEVIDLQLIRAGVRLARVLNQALGS